MTPFILHYRADQTHLIVFPKAWPYNILLSYFLMLQQVFLCWICWQKGGWPSGVGEVQRATCELGSDRIRFNGTLGELGRAEYLEEEWFHPRGCSVACSGGGRASGKHTARQTQAWIRVTWPMALGPCYYALGPWPHTALLMQGFVGLGSWKRVSLRT